MYPIAIGSAVHTHRRRLLFRVGAALMLSLANLESTAEAAWMVRDGSLTVTTPTGETAQIALGSGQAQAVPPSLDLESLVSRAVAAGLAAQASGPPVDHSINPLSWWQDQMRRHQKKSQIDMYRPRLTNFVNRVRWCEECEVVSVCPLPYVRKTGPVAVEIPPRCEGCFGRRISHPASIFSLSSDVLREAHSSLVSDGFSVSYTNNLLNYVRIVLNHARRAGQPVGEIGRMKLPRPRRSIVLWSPDELRALLAVADEAKWPNFVPRPGDWWRVLIGVGVMTGMRLSEMSVLSRDNLTDETVPPDDLLRDEGIRCDHGWFWYLPTKQGDSKPDDLILPRSRVLARCMDLANAFPCRKLLPFSQVTLASYRNRQREYNDEFKRLRALAGIKPRSVRQRDGRTKQVNLTAHKLRKTFESHASRQFGAEWAAAYCGHADRSVSAEHYRDQTRAFVEKVDQLELAALVEEYLP